MEDIGTKLTVQIDVPLERAINCIIGGLEGGYSPWLHGFTPVETIQNRYILDLPDLTRTIWYAREAYWMNGGAAVMIYDLPEHPEGAGNGITTIGLSEIKVALVRMSLKASHHFADLLAENDDAITHDVFMQMLVFEEIIYG